MNNRWVQYSIYFIAFVLIQTLIVNHIQVSIYAYPMVYILAIIMLPIDLNILLTMAIALVLGIVTDALSDTFGLHTSSAVLLAYLRPFILKIFRPRDGYINGILPSIHDMGLTWFLAYAGLCVLTHHIWFFSLEIFRLDLFDLILLKVLVSSLFSFILIFLFQYLFYKPSK